MPTYEYVCKACEHEFESFQSITAKSLRKCPSCSALKLQRRIGTGAGVIFKGSGFYETDYRSDGYKKAAKADNEAASKSDESKTTTDKPDQKSSDKVDAKTKSTKKSEGTTDS